MPGQLRFGVGLEMALKPRKETLPFLNHFGFIVDLENISHQIPIEHDPVIYGNKKAIMDLLRYCFNQANIPANMPLSDENEAKFGDEVGYSKWTMVDDPTIVAHGPAYGVEIVYPIFISDVGSWTFECTGAWQRDIALVSTETEAVE